MGNKDNLSGVWRLASGVWRLASGVWRLIWRLIWRQRIFTGSVQV
jgi:hypothetical protein